MLRAIRKPKVLGVVIIVVTALAAGATPKYKVLHKFSGTDGVGPYGGVVVGQDGSLYGTTVGGGTGHCGLYACGTVFRLTPQANGEWSESVLHSFESDGHGGAGPYSSLVFDAAGNLYGTTSAGGTHFSGVVFELTPTAGRWEETVLHNFCSWQNCNDGGSSTAGVIMDQAGNLYGTAHLVFELSDDAGGWKEIVLHHFTARGTGAVPNLDSSLMPQGISMASRRAAATAPPAGLSLKLCQLPGAAGKKLCSTDSTITARTGTRPEAKP